MLRVCCEVGLFVVLVCMITCYLVGLDLCVCVVLLVFGLLLVSLALACLVV